MGFFVAQIPNPVPRVGASPSRTAPGGGGRSTSGTRTASRRVGIGARSAPLAVQSRHLVDRTRLETDPERRKALFIGAAALAATELPVVCLCSQAPIFACRKGLDGISLTGDGFLRLRDAKIE